MAIIQTLPCIGCHKTSEVEVDFTSYQRYKNGALIQDAFPNLTPEQRELIQTGTHPSCWDAIFAGGEEES